MTIVVVLSLTACSTETNTNTGSSSTQKTAITSIKTTTTDEQARMAPGILKMENTRKGVTGEQAKSLLPLFEAVRSMSTSSLASQYEVDALHKQIEDTLTSDQTKEIDKAIVDDQAALSLIQSLNLQVGTTTTKVTAAVSSSSSSTSAQSGGMQGGPGGGAPPGGEMGGGAAPMGEVGVTGGGASGQTQSTRVFSSVASSGTTTQLLNALITLLKSRAVRIFMPDDPLVM
jgi:hypothetical protein